MLKLLKTVAIAGCLAIAMPVSAATLQGAHVCTIGDGHSPGTSDFSLIGTSWDPGANTGRINGAPAPGGATWSIMGAGAVDVSGFDPGHVGPTQDITSLGVAGWGVAQYASMISAALDVWAAASGFTNLGMVADSGADAGAPDAAGGAQGDIRIAAWEIAAGHHDRGDFRPRRQHRG